MFYRNQLLYLHWSQVYVNTITLSELWGSVSVCACGECACEYVCECVCVPK